MIVGLLNVELFIPSSLSLKDKRRTLKGLIEKLKDNFNISVAEADNHDKWQRSTLGIAYLGQDKASVNSALDKVLNFIEADHNINLTEYQMEIL